MNNGAENGHLDRFDLAIIRALSVDGRMSVTELAKMLGMSKTPCGVRLRRLIKEGYILGFRAIPNPIKLDRAHVAFVEVRLDDTREASLRAFNAAVQRIPEIEQCHLIAGSFDYLLKVRSRDILGYRQVLAEHISALPHVSSTSTYVSMEAIKE